MLTHNNAGPCMHMRQPWTYRVHVAAADGREVHGASQDALRGARPGLRGDPEGALPGLDGTILVVATLVAVRKGARGGAHGAVGGGEPVLEGVARRIRGIVVAGREAARFADGRPRVPVLHAVRAAGPADGRPAGARLLVLVARPPVLLRAGADVIGQLAFGVARRPILGVVAARALVVVLPRGAAAPSGLLERHGDDVRSGPELSHFGQGARSGAEQGKGSKDACVQLHDVKEGSCVDLDADAR